MSMGGSAGRSAKNKTSGERRASQRERDAIDPPGRSDWERAEEERREVRGGMVVAALAVLLFLILVILFSVAAIYAMLT